jgi:hypothetical protein
VLDLLIASSSKYVTIGTILPIGINLMGKKLGSILVGQLWGHGWGDVHDVLHWEA